MSAGATADSLRPGRRRPTIWMVRPVVQEGLSRRAGWVGRWLATQASVTVPNRPNQA